MSAKLSPDEQQADDEGFQSEGDAVVDGNTLYDAAGATLRAPGADVEAEGGGGYESDAASVGSRGGKRKNAAVKLAANAFAGGLAKANTVAGMVPGMGDTSTARATEREIREGEWQIQAHIIEGKCDHVVTTVIGLASTALLAARNLRSANWNGTSDPVVYIQESISMMADYHHSSNSYEVAGGPRPLSSGAAHVDSVWHYVLRLRPTLLLHTRAASSKGGCGSSHCAGI